MQIYSHACNIFDPNIIKPRISERNGSVAKYSFKIDLCRINAGAVQFFCYPGETQINQ